MNIILFQNLPITAIIVGIVLKALFIPVESNKYIIQAARFAKHVRELVEHFLDTVNVKDKALDESSPTDKKG